MHPTDDSRLSCFNTLTWLLSPSPMIDLVFFHLKNYIKSQSANLFSTGLHAKSYQTEKLSGTQISSYSLDAILWIYLN